MVLKSQLNSNLILRANNPMKLGGWCNPSHKYWRYNPNTDNFESLSQPGLYITNTDSSRRLLSIVADTRYLRSVSSLLTRQR